VILVLEAPEGELIMLAVFLIKVAKLAREAIRVKFVLDLFVIAIIEVFEVS